MVCFSQILFEDRIESSLDIEACQMYIPIFCDSYTKHDSKIEKLQKIYLEQPKILDNFSSCFGISLEYKLCKSLYIEIFYEKSHAASNKKK